MNINPLNLTYPRRGFKLFTIPEYAAKFDIPEDVVKRLVSDGSLPVFPVRDGETEEPLIQYLYDSDDGQEIDTSIPEDEAAESFNEFLAYAMGKALEQRDAEREQE